MIKKMRTLIIAFLTALSLMSLTPLAFAAADNSKPVNDRASVADHREKVVIQVSDKDPSKWNLSLNNARNVQAGLGGADKVDVEIVVYGPAIGMLTMDSEVGGRVQNALEAGVKIVACQNTMRGAGLTEADMLPNIGYVPAGVIEIMQKQKQGYSYIRP